MDGDWAAEQARSWPPFLRGSFMEKGRGGDHPSLYPAEREGEKIPKEKERSFADFMKFPREKKKGLQHCEEKGKKGGKRGGRPKSLTITTFTARRLANNVPSHERGRKEGSPRLERMEITKFKPEGGEKEEKAKRVPAGSSIMDPNFIKGGKRVLNQ